MMMTRGRDSARLAAYVATSRSVIRIFAAVIALLGLVLITNEILENAVLCDAGACARIHVSPMLWGLTLTVLGCLILQKGDVSVSLREIVDAGKEVASWRNPFGRRAYDGADAAAIAQPTEEPSTAPATDIPTTRDD